MPEDICTQFQRCLKEMLESPSTASWHSLSEAEKLGLTSHLHPCEENCGKVLNDLMEKAGEWDDAQDAVMDEFFLPLMQRNDD